MTGRSIRAAPATALAAALSFGAAACSDPGGVGGSTAKLAALLHRTDAGRVVMDGGPGPRPAPPRTVRSGLSRRRGLPAAADVRRPRLSLRQLSAEPLRATGHERAEAAARAEEPAAVGLTGELLGRRSHEVSDGGCNAPAWQGHWCCGRAGWSATR